MSFVGKMTQADHRGTGTLIVVTMDQRFRSDADVTSLHTPLRVAAGIPDVDHQNHRTLTS
jgi:hypothetical protein